MIVGSASFTKSPRTNAGARSLKRPGVVDRLEHRPALRAADREVLGPERGRDVHDPGAVVHRDEVAGDHLVRVPRRSDTAARSGPRRGRIRGASRPSFPSSPSTRSRSAAPITRTFAVALDHDVATRCRPRPGPRSTGASTAWWSTPSSDDRARIGEPGIAPAARAEPDEHARVLDRLVAHGDLGVGERGAAPRAVRRDLVGLDEQAAHVQLLQRPPDRLDVLGVHRPVGVGHVDPEADPIRQPLELADVARSPTPGTAG